MRRRSRLVFRRLALLSRSRRRGLNFLLGIFLSTLFRVVLCFDSADYLLLSFFLVLNEFNVRHLTSRRRWNQEEECKDKASKHHRNMEDVGTARRLRHLQDTFGIQRFAMHHHRVVICITHSKSDIQHEHPDNHQRRGASYMHLSERADELDVRSHMSRLAELHETVEDGIGHHKRDQYD